MTDGMTHPHARSVAAAGTHLFVDERGPAHLPPLFVLHGGPGLDHHEFADYLDPLTDTVRLLLVDQRAQGRSDPHAPQDTWTLDQMAADVGALAAALNEPRYAVLGHSYGAFVALQQAVRFPGAAAATIASCGVPSSRWMEGVPARLEAFEPPELREQVRRSWAREAQVSSEADFAALMAEQWPWHFADPQDPRIPEYERRSAGGRLSPEVLRHFAQEAYGGIEVEDQLGGVPQPLLALAGRHDRTCPPEAAELTAQRAPKGELHIFERSGHMPFVEEPEAYLTVVRDFLRRAL